MNYNLLENRRNYNWLRYFRRGKDIIFLLFGLNTYGFSLGFLDYISLGEGGEVGLEVACMC